MAAVCDDKKRSGYGLNGNLAPWIAILLTFLVASGSVVSSISSSAQTTTFVREGLMELKQVHKNDVNAINARLDANRQSLWEGVSQNGDRISDVSRDVNQLIGEFRATRKP